MRKHRFLEHVFARKMYEIAVRFRLSKPDLDKIRSLVGDSFVQIEGTPSKNSNRRKNEIINGLREQRLQIGIEKASK